MLKIACASFLDIKEKPLKNKGKNLNSNKRIRFSIFLSSSVGRVLKINFIFYFALYCARLRVYFLAVCLYG